MLNVFIKREVVRRTAQLSESNRELRDQILERRRAEKEVHALLDENRMLVGKTLMVQENERRHLARELHDEMGQCIAAIQADAKIITKFATQCDARLVNSAEAIKVVSARIYEFVHATMLQLRPSMLDNLGLEDAIREEVITWRSRHQDTSCTLSINTDMDGFDEQTNITIYRIVQECLTNIAKHANARSIAIEFDCIQATLPGDTDNMPVSSLRISIRDDGVGMDAKAHSRGLGLIGMRERAGALGGLLSIQTMLGKGMTIVVTLPLDRSRRSQ